MHLFTGKANLHAWCVIQVRNYFLWYCVDPSNTSYREHTQSKYGMIYQLLDSLISLSSQMMQLKSVEVKSLGPSHVCGTSWTMGLNPGRKLALTQFYMCTMLTSIASQYLRKPDSFNSKQFKETRLARSTLASHLTLWKVTKHLFILNLSLDHFPWLCWEILNLDSLVWMRFMRKPAVLLHFCHLRPMLQRFWLTSV